MCARFHEEAQDPQFRDGELVDELPSEDSKAYLNKIFDKGDRDNSQTLSKLEVTALLKGANGMVAEMTMSDDEIDMISWQLFDDQDTDKDTLLSRQEWIQVFRLFHSCFLPSCLCRQLPYYILSVSRRHVPPHLVYCSHLGC